MRRRLLRILGFTVVGAVLLLAALGVWRKEIVEQAAVWQLDRMGIEAPALTVERLDFGGLTVTGLRAGAFASADRIDVARQGWDPLGWRYRASGIRVKAVYLGDRLSVGPFQILPGGGGSGGEAALPDVVVEGLDLTAATDFGPVRLLLPGTVSAAPGGPVRLDSAITFTHDRLSARGEMRTTASTDGLAAVTARFDEIELTAEGRSIRAGDVEIDADLQPDFADIRLRGRLPGLSAAVELDLTAAAPMLHPVLEARARLQLDSLDPLGSFLPEADLPSGSLSAELTVGGELDVASLLGGEQPFHAFVGDIGLRSEGALTGIAGVADALDFATVSRAAVAAGGQVSVEMGDASFRFEGLNPDLIPPEIAAAGRAPLIGETVTVSVRSGTLVSGLDIARLVTGEALQATLSGRFGIESLARAELAVGLARIAPDQLSADAVQADIHSLVVDGVPVHLARLTGSGWLGDGASFDGLLEIEAGPVAQGGRGAETVTARLPLNYRNDGQTGEGRLTDAAVTLAGVRTGSDEVSLPGPVEASLSARVKTGPCSFRACALEPDAATATIVAGTLALETAAAGRIDMEEISAQVAIPSLSAKRPVLDLKADVARLISVQHGQAEDLSLEGRTDLSLSRLGHRLTVARIDALPVKGLRPPPVALGAELSGSLSDPRINGEISLIGRKIPPLKVTANRRSVRVEMLQANLADILELDAVGAVLPVLVEEAGGRVSVLVELDPATASPTVELEFIDVGGAANSVFFSLLNGRFRLGSVAPVRSDGVQRLTLKRLDAGAVLENVEVDIAINETAGETQAVVSRLSGDVFDGRFAFEPVTFSSEGELPELRLKLTDVELGAMTGLLGLEGFALEGRMDGEIPFAVDSENRVAIRGGRLAATGPGVMRLKLDEFRAMLAESMGDQADILLNALLDFHHTVLEARIDKPFDGDEKVAIRLEGSNPAHLDGQPLVFNISLESNVIRLAEPLYGLYRSTLGSVENFVRTFNEDR